MFSRVSRFGQNLSPYENGCAHAPVVEKAGGLLGSRVNPTLRKLLAASLLWIAFAQGVSATGVEPAKDLRVDPALCLAAALARDDDKTVAACGALIDNGKTEKADRI